LSLLALLYPVAAILMDVQHTGPPNASSRLRVCKPRLSTRRCVLVSWTLQNPRLR
jgi:hypothetical protein